MSLAGNHDVLAERVVKMCQTQPKAVNWFYRGGITVNGEHVGFYRIPTVTVHRDFVTNFSDIITLEVLVETRKVYDTLIPNASNLSGWLEWEQMGENSVEFVRGGLRDKREYKAIVMNLPTQGLGNGSNQGNVVQDPDLSVTALTVQFIDKTSLDLKFYTWSGLMEMTNPMNALQMILMGTGKDLGIDGVNSVDADVKDNRQILVPRGTTVKDMVQYFQKNYGIYNHGIGSYVFETEKGRYWFVYPLYNNNRYQKEYFKLNIFVVPKKFDPNGIPRTYYVQDGKITAYTINQATMVDNNASNQLNQGTGIQVVNTLENRGDNVKEVGPNKQYIDGSVGVTSFNMYDRPDGYKNYTQVHADNNNMASLRSSIAGNEGRYITLDWSFANPWLLQPGMPVKIDYIDGGLKTLYGTLHEYVAVSVIQGKTPMEVPYNCTVKMRVYVTEQPNVPL